MSTKTDQSLLPNGLRDVLPPEATQDASVVNGLMEHFRASAYRRVDPPLVEFEDSLLSGPGAATAPQTFRLMDPLSQRMMGLRSDMTGQVARVATTRLANSVRPLRLCYAGPVLRVRSSQLRPERQLMQAGCELIGTDAPEADTEIITVAVEALSTVGAKNLSVDLSLPTIVPTIFDALDLSEPVRDAARQALDRKDAGDIAKLGGPASTKLGALLAATGPADDALEKLMAIDLPEGAAGERDRLVNVLAGLNEALPDVQVTIDPVEHRGFEYQTGLSFTIFARGVRGELARGGRYLAGSTGEWATGFTIYLDSLMRAVPAAPPEEVVFVPYGTPAVIGRTLRANGWRTLAGLMENEDIEKTARDHGCSHMADPTGKAEPRRL